MEIEYKFELEDWMAFLKHYQKNSKQYIRNKRIATFIVPVVFSFLIFLDFLKDVFNPIGIIIYAIISLIWVILYPKRFTRRSLGKTKRMIEDGDNSGFLGTHKLVLNDTEIIITLPESEQKINWNGIKKLEESEEYYFLFDTAVSAIIIPKNKVVANISELDRLLKTNIA